MRTRTAMRLWVWLAVAFGVAAVIGLLRGSPDARERLGGFVFVAFLAGMSIWAIRYRSQVRRSSFEAQAEEAGLRAEPGDPLGLLDSGFALFRRAATISEVETTASGSRSGVDTAVVDHWLARSSDPQRADTERYTCVLTPTPSWWPAVSVLPETLAARVRSAIGLPDVELELEAFNRRFAVSSSDRRFASALLDARMMDWLLERPAGMGFEVRDGRLLSFAPRSATTLDDVRRALDLHDELLRHVPGVVLRDPI